MMLIMVFCHPDQFVIMLVLEIRQGQHLYFKNPCDAEVDLKHSDSFPP